MIAIGERIREARKAAGLTEAEFGALIGKSVQTVYRYETGKYDPSVSVLEEIANALGVSLGYLLGISNPLAHVTLIEVEHELGPYRMDEVALFNINRISEEEAMRCVKAGVYNDNVLCIPKRQWVALFRDGKEY